MAVRERVQPEAGKLVDMSWDPITRIIGNLGIYTKIDFENREVVECKSTSSLFRGYSVFMKGKDPRDAGFITSRICGICGDNHTTCDIMRSYNPFTGKMYLEALQMSRLTREMFCLMEGRHVHPSTLYPGGTGTVATPQVFTDYLSRLIHVTDFVKEAVPLNDDLFDFFYEALPGYEEVGRRRVLLGCWGAFQDAQECDYRYEHMSDWGRKMKVTPGVIVDGQLLTTDLVEINLGLRILLGSSYYDDWVEEEMFVPRDPLGNAVDRRHPWNQTTLPKPQKRDLEGGNYSWVMSPRWDAG